jgi:hypothetical protein
MVWPVDVRGRLTHLSPLEGTGLLPEMNLCFNIFHYGGIIYNVKNNETLIRTMFYRYGREVLLIHLH